MRRIYIGNRSEWRRWLAENHDKDAQGIWLVFQRKTPGSHCLEYGEAVEEALCFGWIDSIIKRIDDNTYCRKFTPRRPESYWSSLNKKRVERMIREGRMTEFGLAKVTSAKRSGTWDRDARPALSLTIPGELSDALVKSPRAKAFFEILPPSCQKQFIGWIATAKKPETKAKRVAETLVMLDKRKKLGLK